MAIAIADSWEGRSTSSTLAVPVTGFELGDLIVVFTFCAGSGSPATPTDSGSNTYTERAQTTADATFTYTVGIADARCDTVPTSVNVSNGAGGANDVAAVVMRVTHNGTVWMETGNVLPVNVTADDPTTTALTIYQTPVEGLENDGSALLLAALTHDGATTTFAPAAGWTEVEEEEDTASGIPYSVVSKVVTLSGPFSHQWTTGASRDYAYVLAAYTENVPAPSVHLVTTAPSPTVTGTTMTVTSADTDYPDPALETFQVLVHEPSVIPTLENSEFVNVAARAAGVWTSIERAQGASHSQPIDVGWYVWWDHFYRDPDDLLAYVASIELDTVKVQASSAASDAADATAAVAEIHDAFADERVYTYVFERTGTTLVTANRAVLSYLLVPREITVTSVSWGISAAAGNADVGIYSGDPAGTLTLLWSRGSHSAGSGAITTLISAGTPTTLTLSPGVYWLAIAGSSGSLGILGTTTYYPGTGYREGTSFPLPSTITTATENSTGEITPWGRLNQ